MLVGKHRTAKQAVNFGRRHYEVSFPCTCRDRVVLLVSHKVDLTAMNKNPVSRPRIASEKDRWKKSAVGVLSLDFKGSCL